MPLNIPTSEELVARIALRIGGESVPLTDLSTIGVARQFIQLGMVEEYMGLWAGLAQAADRDWFVQTAEGSALDRRIADFGVSRPSAQKAYGFLTVQTEPAETLVIPAGGLVVRTNPATGDPVKFVARANENSPDGSWTIIEIGSIIVEASQAGAIGNVAANTIVGVDQRGFTGNLLSVTNPQAFTNGKDSASDAETREHFRRALLGLKRGTRAGILFGIRGYTEPNTLRTVRSVAIEEWGGQTLLNASGKPVALKVYISESLGDGTASSGLVAAVQNLVDGNDEESDSGLRAAGVPTAVVASTPRPIDVRLAVDIDRAFGAETVRQQVADAVNRFFGGLEIGGYQVTGEIQGQVVFSQLFKAVMNVDGVLRVVFQSPRDDIAIATGMQATVRTLDVIIGEVI